MKTLPKVIGLAASVILAGCATNHKAATSSEFRIGPTAFNGITYYPVKPGATYDNVPADYTTNPPPAGVPDYVNVITTNSIHIRYVDGPGASK